MIPYAADVPMKRMPIANWALIGFTVLVSVALWEGSDAVFSRLALWQGDIQRMAADINRQAGRNVVTASDLKGCGFHFYQLATCAFLHAGFWHLFGNMLFLFVFGNSVNAKLGHAAYIGLYLALAVLTSAAWLAFPGGAYVMVGASGAVMGVAGMYLVLYPLNDVSMLWSLFTFQISGIWLILAYLALDILGVFAGGGGVAYVSHVAGTLVGAGTAAALLATGRVKPGAGERTLLEMLGMTLEHEDTGRPKVMMRRTAAGTVAVAAPRASSVPGAARAEGADPLPPKRGLYDHMPIDVPQAVRPRPAPRKAGPARQGGRPVPRPAGPIMPSADDLPPIEFSGGDGAVDDEDEGRGESGPISL